MLVIKKYSNRRLYNTKTSKYVNLEDLYQMIKNDQEFVVQDIKTEKDITGLILTQILVEREAAFNLMPVSFLRFLINFYDNKFNVLFSNYLTQSMQNFANNKPYFDEEWYNDLSPIKAFEQITKQNIELFQKGFENLFNKGEKN